MNEAAEIVEKCRAQGIQLSANGAKLRIESPGPLDDATKAALSRFKVDLLALLASDPQSAMLDEAKTLAAEVGRLNGIAPETIQRAIGEIELFTHDETTQFIADARKWLAAAESEK